MRDRRDARRLTAYGTLYKALDRLANTGILVSRWEDPHLAAAEGRPRRRFYQVTPIGEQALAAAVGDARTPPLARSAEVGT